MSKVIIYNNELGGVSVIHPTGTIEACMKDIPKSADHKIIDKSNLPSNRTFRNAWIKDGSTIKTDIPKGKELVKDMLRFKREPLLKALDIEFMQAIEADNPSEQTRIKNEKQALRDITEHADISGARNETDLKACLDLI